MTLQQSTLSTSFSLDQTLYSLNTHTTLEVSHLLLVNHLLHESITFSWLKYPSLNHTTLFGLITFSWLKPFSCMFSLLVSCLGKPFILMHAFLVSPMLRKILISFIFVLSNPVLRQTLFMQVCLVSPMLDIPLHACLPC